MAPQTDSHLLVSFKNISRTAGISAVAVGILCARPQRGFMEGGATSYFILPSTAGKK
jgi:hypothetical protein